VCSSDLVVACLAAAVGASMGGAAMYRWSTQDPEAALRAVAAVPAVSGPMIVNANLAMARDGWLVAAMKGPVTSTPYKVYALLAPSHGASLPAFALAALPVRLPRFLFVAACFALLKRAVEPRFGPKWIASGFAIGWLLFYVWFWASHPG
jgi:hypothetical protein